MARSLHDAPFPATKEELVDYSIRCFLPEDVIQALQDMETEENQSFESIEDIWPDYPTSNDDFLWDPEDF